MAYLVIEDLIEDSELDQAAMRAIVGGAANKGVQLSLMNRVWGTVDVHLVESKLVSGLVKTSAFKLPDH